MLFSMELLTTGSAAKQSIYFELWLLNNNEETGRIMSFWAFVGLKW